MDMIFNEVSTIQKAKDIPTAHAWIKTIINTISAFSTHGYKFIRIDEDTREIHLTESYSLYDFLCDNNSKIRTIRSIALQKFRPPYNISDYETITKKAFHLHKDGTYIECFGLGIASDQNIPAIGFFSEEFWKNTTFTIRSTCSKTQTKKTCNAHCVSLPDHSQNTNTISFIESLRPVSLCKSELPPHKKRTSFSGNHHGKEELTALARKLNNCPYVTGPLHSVEYCPTSTSSIKDPSIDGKITVVLTKSDAGFALRLQTTGRNLRETIAIGDIIKKLL